MDSQSGTVYPTVEFWRSTYQPTKKKIDPTLQRDLKWGWLVPYLIELDVLFWHRWDYWGRTMEAGKILDEAIPEIEFGTDLAATPARKNLEDCLNAITGHSWAGWGSWQYFDYFLDWLLYGFGHSGHKELVPEPDGCAGASMRLYQTFDLGVQLMYPNDYFGQIMSENSFGKRAGFYPTPNDVVDLIVRMTMPQETDKASSVMDPCLGTGRFLLYASNRSLNLWGQDINLTCVKASIINGYMYAPWLVKPFPFIRDVAHENSAVISDQMAAVGSSRPDVGAYLAESEHDPEAQPKFEPIKVRRRKMAAGQLTIWETQE